RAGVLADFCRLLALPRRSPLFPYTTLFRSLRDGGGDAGLIEGHEDEVRGVRVRNEAGDRVLRVDCHADLHARPPDVTEGCLQGQDRKSTRLNSSHVKISYAVFCLKKK